MKNVLLLAEGFLVLSQYKTRPGTDILTLITTLNNAGLLGMNIPEDERDKPTIDHRHAVFTNYVNPALDKFNVDEKINIHITVDANLNVTLRIPENKQVQQELQGTLGVVMTKALKGLPSRPDSTTWQIMDDLW